MTPGDSWLNRDDEQPILPGALPGQPGDAAWGAEEKLHQDAGKVPKLRVHYYSATTEGLINRSTVHHCLEQNLLVQL